MSYYIAAVEQPGYIAPPDRYSRVNQPGPTGQIELLAFPSAPNGWMPCQGQLLPIPDYPRLFDLLGARYGGDGESTFAVPKLSPVKTTDRKADLKWYINLIGPYPTEPDAFPEELMGSIELLPYDFSPPNFMMCDGRALTIEEHPTLFSIIGTKFGGDGKKTFRLPKLAPLAGVGHFMCIAGIIPLRHELS